MKNYNRDYRRTWICRESFNRIASCSCEAAARACASVCTLTCENLRFLFDLRSFIVRFIWSRPVWCSWSFFLRCFDTIGTKLIIAPIVLHVRSLFLLCGYLRIDLLYGVARRCMHVYNEVYSIRRCCGLCVSLGGCMSWMQVGYRINWFCWITGMDFSIANCSYAHEQVDRTLVSCSCMLSLIVLNLNNDCFVIDICDFRWVLQWVPHP